MQGCIEDPTIVCIEEAAKEANYIEETAKIILCTKSRQMNTLAIEQIVTFETKN